MKVINGVLENVEAVEIFNGTFTFPDDVTTIGYGAFESCFTLTHITIPEHITAIEESAFYGCTNLKSIKISKNIKAIPKDTFNRCYNLENITIPDSVIMIGDDAFNDCTSLETIEIPETVKLIGEGAFCNCTSLKNITIPKGITVIKVSTFEDCQYLENIVIPDGVTSIEEYAFERCRTLKDVVIPKSVTVIGESAFEDCECLESVVIPNSVTSIGEYAFRRCYQLKNISFPESVKTIKKGALELCISLKKIIIPEGITEIGQVAFSQCQSLKSVKIPESVKIIRKEAFKGCSKLEIINLPQSIQTIEEKVFTNCNIKQITTPWGNINSPLKFSNRGIIIEYLYSYANNILKNKYYDIYQFERYITFDESLNGKDAIQKFKNLFYKMRKTYDISPALLERLSLKTTEQFNLNTWNQIKLLFRAYGFNQNNIDMSEALSEIIEIFGLFENNTKKERRIKQFEQFIIERPYRLSIENYQKIISIYPKKVEEFFRPIATNTQYTVIKENVEIPTEFTIYLKEKLTDDQIKYIKKLTGTYGKKINDFLKENYETKFLPEFELKSEYYDREEIELILFNCDIIGHVNYSSLHRMFDGCKKEFDEDFYEFFMENLAFILNDEKLQSNLRNIQTKFDKIKKHYSRMSGVQNVTLKQAIDYLENETFDYHDGNYELAQDVKKAGVSSQEAFDYYQKVFETNNTRKLSSLIKRSNIYEIDGFTIKAELLRRDDSFGMLVGEINYTNCCQVFGGVGHNCMAHAVNSDDGGVFVTRLLQDGEWILLTQSWDWQNNNVYCHDNIEGTEYFKNNPELRKAVAKVFKLDGEFIIEKSKTEVENYIKTRKKIVEKSLSEDKEDELQELSDLEKREVIRVVTTGSGNDDLGLSNYFQQRLAIAALNIESTLNTVNEITLLKKSKYLPYHFQPVNYNPSQIYFNSEERAYTDSSLVQYIIAGSIEDLCIGKLEPLVPIYRDERRVVLEQGENIRNYTTKKIKDMEKAIYPKIMQEYQDRSQYDFEASHIYLGEDWYLIYRENEDNTIYISDLAKIKPSLDDENGIQNQEIMNVVYNLVRKYDSIQADLKEDTSYLLFLINKKLGYLEQIGEDVSYHFGNNSNGRIITEGEQEAILKNAKTIKAKGNPEQLMHRVTFKRGRLLEQEAIEHKKI